MLNRIHHCIADGIGLARVMLTLTDGAPAADGLFAIPHAGSPLGRVAGARVHETIDVMRHPRRAVASAVEDAQTVAKLVLLGFDPASPIKGPQHAAHRVAWSDPSPAGRAGQPFLLQNYDVTVGDLWILILLWIAAGPATVRAIAARRPPDQRR